MQSDAVAMHVLWRETNNRLEVLAARVREGVDVLAASEFCRWLQFSGVLAMLEDQERSQPLPVNGRELRRKVDELIMDCGDWFRLHENSNTLPHPSIPRTELERINKQLADLSAQLAMVLPPSTANTADVGKPAEPALHVIEGGSS